MFLSEYQEYCKNLKVPTEKAKIDSKEDTNRNKLLELLGIDKSKLKNRKKI